MKRDFSMVYPVSLLYCYFLNSEGAFDRKYEEMGKRGTYLM